MPQPKLIARLRQAGAFLLIGGIAFVIDALAYNALVFWVDGNGPLRDLPLVAKVTAIVLASIVTYLGNRFWTFQQRRLERKWSRYVLFVGFNLIAMSLQLGCLGFSRYILGLDGVVADNISGTLIGQALATVFRFITYDRFVFANDRASTVSHSGNRVVGPRDATR